MACMHTYVISRKGKLRIVTNHSASQLSLNSLIGCDNRAVPLCGLQQLGYNLQHTRDCYPQCQLLLFKCNVKGVYRLVPMHPLW